MKTPTLVVAAALLATPVFAQTTTAPQSNAPAATNQTMTKPATGQWRASKLIGVDVYNLFNSNAETNFVLNTGSRFQNLIAALDPRAFKLGLRFQF